MSETTTTTAPVRSRTRRLRPRVRKLVLLLHIVSAGAWIGIDVVLGVLVFSARLTGDPGIESVSYQALALFAVWPLAVSGLVCLASGVILGLGTKYGLLRYWWVAVKLVLNLVLITLVLVLLRPEVGKAAEYGRAIGAGRTSGLDVSSLAFPPVVSLTALLIATILSVFKPWGRIPRASA